MVARSWLAVALASLAAASAIGCGAKAEDQPPPMAAQGSRSSHAVVIVLENREFGEVIGNAEAPFINRLAKRGALATRYYAITHPSLPNYLALLGGSTFGIETDCTSCEARGPNLATQLSRAGIPWRAYMEELPRRCYRGASAGDYVKRHNPFMYFPSIASDPHLCSDVVPITQLDANLRKDALPTFAWIGLDLCDDAHSCVLGDADQRLAQLVPALRRQLGPHGFLVVTFDEGSSDKGCCGVPGGGRVMTILEGPDVRHGARLQDPYDHYSLLATLEDRFGLPRLRHARDSTSLRAAFER